MNRPPDFRDWQHVTLPDARDAADALGWRDQLEQDAAADAAEGQDFRAAFVFRLVNGIGDAVRAGTPLDSLPGRAVELFNLAGRPPGRGDVGD